MKASAKTKTTESTKTKTETKVEVPAKLQAITKELAANATSIKSLVSAGESIMDRASMVLKELYDDRDEATPFLKAAFEAEGLTNMNAKSQRSRILNHAFPADEKLLTLAKSAPIRFHNAKGDIVEKKANVNQLNAIAAGSFAPNKKGTLWLPVEKSAGGSGGSNRRTPVESAKKAIEDSATVFITVGKNPAIAFFNLVIEVLQSVKGWNFDKAEAAALLEN